jgi:hypothetical protein
MAEKANQPGASHYVVEDRGIEPPQDSSENTPFSEIGGTESGTVSAQSAPFPPDLAAVAAAWPNLPDATRQAIVAIIREGRLA